MRIHPLFDEYVASIALAPHVGNFHSVAKARKDWVEAGRPVEAQEAAAIANNQIDNLSYCNDNQRKEIERLEQKLRERESFVTALQAHNTALTLALRSGHDAVVDEASRRILQMKTEVRGS